METILFLAVVIMFFWIASVSNRLKTLERSLKKGGVVVPETVTEKGFLQPKTAGVIPLQTIAMPVPPKEEVVKAPLTEAEQTEIATNWLNKIGVVALVLGMVFFFKYAIDQGWVSEWTRVIVGFLVAGLLVYLGELWKEKYGKRAYGLSGGGIALFYFTIFAAYQFYSLVSQPVAWVIMLIIAGLSVFLSFRYSSLTLGALGFVGAYGSPIMLNSGQDQQIPLLVYLTILNIVTFVVCLKKYWVELYYLSFFGTIINFSVWASNYSNKENTFISLFFVIITTMLVILGSIALVRFHKSKNSLPEHFDDNLSIFYIFSGLFYFVSVWFLLTDKFHSFLAPIALLGAVIIFFAYALIDRLEYKNINYALSFVASSLLVFAAIWQYDNKALALALLALALLGSSIGFLLKREEIRVWSIIVLFMALFSSLFQPYTKADELFLFNAKFGLMFANTLAMLFVGWLYSKFTPSEFVKNAEQALQIVSALVLWVAISWDMTSGLSGYGSRTVQNSMTLWWVVYPVVLATAAVIGKRTALLKLSMALIIAALIKVVILPYENEAVFITNAKFGLMILQAIALFVVGNLYTKSENNSESADTLNVMASLFLWFAVTWEIAQYFSSNTQNLLLSLWWVVYAVILMIVSTVFKKSVFRKVSIVLFALSILKVFLYDVQALDTPYRIVAFIVLGVILLTVSFSYNRNKEKIVNFLEGDGK